MISILIITAIVVFLISNFAASAKGTIDYSDSFDGWQLACGQGLIIETLKSCFVTKKFSDNSGHMLEMTVGFAKYMEHFSRNYLLFSGIEAVGDLQYGREGASSTLDLISSGSSYISNQSGLVQNFVEELEYTGDLAWKLGNSTFIINGFSERLLHKKVNIYLFSTSGGAISDKKIFDKETFFEGNIDWFATCGTTKGATGCAVASPDFSSELSLSIYIIHKDNNFRTSIMFTGKFASNEIKYQIDNGEYLDLAANMKIDESSQYFSNDNEKLYSFIKHAIDADKITIITEKGTRAISARHLTHIFAKALASVGGDIPDWLDFSMRYDLKHLRRN